MYRLDRVVAHLGKTMINTYGGVLERRKQEKIEENLQCLFIHYQPHKKAPGFEPE
jgi:hypothetical protein